MGAQPSNCPSGCCVHSSVSLQDSHIAVFLPPVVCRHHFLNQIGIGKRTNNFFILFFFFFSFLPSFKCTIINGFGHFKAFVVSHSETFCTLCFYCDGVITTVVFFQCHSLSAKYESYCFDYFDERGIFRKSYANIMGTQGCPETLTMLCMYTNE